ncbi:MAG TPA: hypothetical protein VHI93_04925, partial [Candidatus Thermoplasmatota archaeon]|nr:hypothetical protein [Candidatus Thermoplasmatota archaeon]
MRGAARKSSKTPRDRAESSDCTQATLTLKGHASHVYGVAFSPDGKRIVSGSGDMTVRVWDAITGGEAHTLRGHTGSVQSVAFSPDGKR